MERLQQHSQIVDFSVLATRKLRDVFGTPSRLPVPQGNESWVYDGLFMISVKEAVKSATAAFGELFPNAIDVRLEEIEMSDAGPWWDVTLSYAVPPTSAVAAVMGRSDRIYKLVQVARDDGSLHSVKIRTI